MQPVKIIGVASGWGSPDRGCADGPDALREAGLVTRLETRRISVSWEETLSPGAGEKSPLAIVRELCERLAQKTANAITGGNLPLVIGGDHSCAIGTWSGAWLALRGKGPLGLIWVDAHMDSHTHATSPSGALHGMPLACLMGYGEPALVNLAAPLPKLLPQHLCLVGVRSFEEGEADLLSRLEVRIFFSEEVERRGLDAVMQEALKIVRNGTAGFGLSIDLDAINPHESPGVGTPAADGLHASSLIQALRQLNRHPDLIAVELAEYNPYRDHGGLTAHQAEGILAALLAPR